MNKTCSDCKRACLSKDGKTFFCAVVQDEGLASSGYAEECSLFRPMTNYEKYFGTPELLAERLWQLEALDDKEQYIEWLKQEAEE